MTETHFIIDGKTLASVTTKFPLCIESFPQPYEVSIFSSEAEYQSLVLDADFILIDKNVANRYPPTTSDGTYVFTLAATEDNKSMTTVLSIIDAFIDQNISKGSKVVAIGGGIIQDLAACACGLFRRGQPFIYLPTTSLGQLDSCVGGKCAINTGKAKNIIGLFSAPKQVVIPVFMVRSMPLNEHRAGLSEMLRLCLTASWKAVHDYVSIFPCISDPSTLDLEAYTKALALSLSIKKAVVDYDEYERNVRKSMNYGHTFGHAIEKLANFSLPHGLGVLLGMHMANTFSYKSGFMARETYAGVTSPLKMTLTNVRLNSDHLCGLTSDEIIDQFRYDKKGDGTSVPLILINSPGNMFFHRYYFGHPSNVLADSIDSCLSEFLLWIT
jgi:3-dehydroquinate synthase